MDQFREIVEDLGMSVTDREAEIFLDNIDSTCAAYDLIDQTPDYLPEVMYPRSAGYRPSAEENPYNAWYWKTDVKGAPRPNCLASAFR
jgi:amidase